MPPALVQLNAREPVLPDAAEPTTTPASLMSLAKLYAPPRAPMSVTPLASQYAARPKFASFRARPTICPASLMRYASEYWFVEDRFASSWKLVGLSHSV